jgi:hypothetical protein
MLRVLVFVNWTIHKVRAFDVNIRNPDQIVPGERYWFFKYWPKNVSVDVVGIKKNFFLYPLENLSRIYVQHAIAFNQIKDCDLLLTFDSQSAFLFALLKSKLGIFKSIPHVMIDVGLPNAAETLKTIPSSLIYRLLNQSFNVKSVSHIIFTEVLLVFLILLCHTYLSALKRITSNQNQLKMKAIFFQQVSIGISLLS